MLAVALLGLEILIAVPTAALAWTRPPLEGVSPNQIEDVAFLLSFFTFVPVGALIAAKRPFHPVGWLFCAGGIAMTAANLATEYAIYALIRFPGSLPSGVFVSWVASWSWSLAFPLIGLVMLLFPTGRPPSRRWWILGGVQIGSSLSVAVMAALAAWPHRGPQLLVGEDFDGLESGPLAAVAFVLIATMFLGIAAAMVSLVVRFRRSRGIQRQQLKWLALVGSAGSFLLVIVVGSGMSGIGDGLAVRVAELGLNLMGLGFPIAAAIAILKHRLFDIDRIINRALVYTALTAVLAGFYAGLVVVMQQALGSVVRESDIAVAVTTLIVAGLFGPVRRWMQGFIDRRFYRRRYDASREIERFSKRLRDQIEPVTLESEILATVSETMGPSKAMLWVARRT